MLAGLAPVLALTLAASTPAPPWGAELALARPFGDHMVLQRDAPVALWGSASPGETITVIFPPHIVSTRADLLGRWALDLPAMAAEAKGRTLRVEGREDALVLEDVLVGEVWLCSGQVPPTAEIASGEAVDRRLRWLDFRPQADPGPGPFDGSELAACRSGSYFEGAWGMEPAGLSPHLVDFGRRLVAELDVPVGLIHNAVAGAPVESWLRSEVLVESFGFAGGVGTWLDDPRLNPACRARASDNLSGWMETVLAAAERGDLPPATPGHPYQPGFLFEAGISPLLGSSLAGVVWVQGASNVHDPRLFRDLTRTLILDWRKLLGRPRLRFLQLQLHAAGDDVEGEGEGWQQVREVQRRMASEISGVELAVSLESAGAAAGGGTGQRLAQVALARVYGREDEPWGPLLRAHICGEGRVQLYFEGTDGGLTVGGGETLMGFEVAGTDGRFRAAEARLVGRDLVELQHPEVKDPRVARYGWAARPEGNLEGASGLPAAPFHTGDPFETPAGDS